MHVPMVNIWEMRVAVRDGDMPMRMTVRLLSIPPLRMFMLMVLIVNMAMAMFQRFMGMLMSMLFSQMQPHS